MRIDYTSEDGTGVFCQLATMDRLQGLGIATMLIGAAEQRVRARGLAFAALGVENDNPLQELQSLVRAGTGTAPSAERPFSA